MLLIKKEGGVELINKKENSFRYKLKPGRLAKFNKKDKKLSVEEVNAEKFTSWKDGVVNIYNLLLEDVAKTLQKRYNQKFRIADDAKEFRYTFTIKNESLDEVIELIKAITPVKAIMKGDYIEFSLDKKKKQNMRK